MIGKKDVFHIISQRTRMLICSQILWLWIYIYFIYYIDVNKSIFHSFINPFTSLGKERENRRPKVHKNEPLEINMTAHFLQASYSHQAEWQDV